MKNSPKLARTVSPRCEPISLGMVRTIEIRVSAGKLIASAGMGNLASGAAERARRRYVSDDPMDGLERELESLWYGSDPFETVNGAAIVDGDDLLRDTVRSAVRGTGDNDDGKRGADQVLRHKATPGYYADHVRIMSDGTVTRELAWDGQALLTGVDAERFKSAAHRDQFEKMTAARKAKAKPAGKAKRLSRKQKLAAAAQAQARSDAKAKIQARREFHKAGQKAAKREAAKRANAVDAI